MSDTGLNIKDKNRWDIQCWHQLFYEAGIDNTFTSFRDTGASISFEYSDCPTRTFNIPDGTGGWTQQISAIAAGISSIHPEYQNVTTYCTVPGSNPPSGCAGIATPIVFLQDMKWRYAGFRICPGDKFPFRVIYNSNQRRDVILDFNVVKTPIIYWDRCVNKVTNEVFWRVVGTDELIPESDFEDGRPSCSLPCSQSFPELPTVIPCDSEITDGCFCSRDGTQPTINGVTLIAKVCEGEILQVDYYSEFGEDTQELLDSDGYYFDPTCNCSSLPVCIRTYSRCSAETCEKVEFCELDNGEIVGPFIPGTQDLSEVEGPFVQCECPQPQTCDCFDINAEPEIFPLTPSRSLVPRDADDIVAVGTNGVSATFTAPVTNKPNQNVSISQHNSGAINYGNLSQSDAGETIENTISFSSPSYFCIRTPDAVTAINQSDEFTFTAPQGVSWVVDSSNNADIQVSGNVVTVRGDSNSGTGGGSPFAEFELSLSGPVSSIGVLYTTLAPINNVNNGRFLFSVKEYPIIESLPVKLCPENLAAMQTAVSSPLVKEQCWEADVEPTLIGPDIASDSAGFDWDANGASYNLTNPTGNEVVLTAIQIATIDGNGSQMQITVDGIVSDVATATSQDEVVLFMLSSPVTIPAGSSVQLFMGGPDNVGSWSHAEANSQHPWLGFDTIGISLFEGGGRQSFTVCGELAYDKYNNEVELPVNAVLVECFDSEECLTQIKEFQGKQEFKRRCFERPARPVDTIDVFDSGINVPLSENIVVTPNEPGLVDCVIVRILGNETDLSNATSTGVTIDLTQPNGQVQTLFLLGVSRITKRTIGLEKGELDNTINVNYMLCDLVPFQMGVGESFQLGNLQNVSSSNVTWSNGPDNDGGQAAFSSNTRFFPDVALLNGEIERSFEITDCNGDTRFEDDLCNIIDGIPSGSEQVPSAKLGDLLGELKQLNSTGEKLYFQECEFSENSGAEVGSYRRLGVWSAVDVANGGSGTSGISQEEAAVDVAGNPVWGFGIQANAPGNFPDTDQNFPNLPWYNTENSEDPPANFQADVPNTADPETWRFLDKYDGNFEYEKNVYEIYVTLPPGCVSGVSEIQFALERITGRGYGEIWLANSHNPADAQLYFNYNRSGAPFNYYSLTQGPVIALDQANPNRFYIRVYAIDGSEPSAANDHFNAAAFNPQLFMLSDGNIGRIPLNSFGPSPADVNGESQLGEAWCLEGGVATSCSGRCISERDFFESVNAVQVTQTDFKIACGAPNTTIGNQELHEKLCSIDDKLGQLITLFGDCDDSSNGGGSVTLPPARGKIVSDNFQDGEANATFNLQVRNTNGGDVNWQALVENVPYATIPGLAAGSYTLVTTDNGDGTFNHLFTGTQTLVGFANITITGGIPDPPGNGSGLTLYCEAAQ